MSWVNNVAFVSAAMFVELALRGIMQDSVM
jgi:hypothetical protein